MLLLDNLMEMVREKTDLIQNDAGDCPGTGFCGRLLNVL